MLFSDPQSDNESGGNAEECSVKKVEIECDKTRG